MENFLRKDEKKKQVFVFHKPVPGAKTAVTRYKTLQRRGELALVEVELLTGRTHQIRATMADLGCAPAGETASTETERKPAFGGPRRPFLCYGDQIRLLQSLPLTCPRMQVS